MDKLTIFTEDNALSAVEVLNDTDTIAQRLKALGIGFEQWQTDAPLSAEADESEVIAAYQSSINDLKRQHGFHTVDVAAIHPDHPQAEELRKKFLCEHTHDDFEARYFVDGSGMFYIHAVGHVFMLRCDKGDLVNLPALTPHWFDMGAKPDFKAIRFFRIAEGWVGLPTGSDIAERFPRFETAA
ncbi:MAG: cupin [Zetaproteobacteria bacterium CG_4_9_14_3_um_filter_49_83]|nr:MAG: cupin [Zetaproteobacteria bacterium CG17_big_fil_post_rev_8_21_14_2_50_50_13]PIV29283.1 MAG: cupin [Zetaproteobacteria bacterium CG02_land_8_20_14_3_00_50_9]PIY54663.1 MAG: cupin [Zetaproteobacteria bacterium CG_4_10_14_0_8_um_filter_49_80]PJA35606.1 MAG: cupin [Zetaproteobacteria bacterium CG_4_9_14_3_um_filter_49_83]